MISLINSLGEILYLDACTSFSQQLSASLTKNPIDGTGSTPSSVVNDHVIVDNMKVSVSGVVSNSDWHYGRPNIKILEQAGGKVEINNTPLIELPAILESATTLLNRLPFQFTFAGEPLQSRIPTNTRDNFVEQAKLFLQSALANAEFINIVDTKKLEYFNDFILLDVSVRVDESSGDSLFVDLQFEKPNIVQSKRVQVKPVVEQKAAASKKSGTKGSTTTSSTSSSTPAAEVAAELEKLDPNDERISVLEKNIALKKARAEAGAR